MATVKGPVDTSKMFCFNLPPKVNSRGLFFHHWLEYSMPIFEIQLVLSFVITQASYFVLKRLGLPMFICQLIAGVVLSFALLKNQNHRDDIGSEGSIEVLGTISTIGYAFFLFQIGVKVDLSMIGRAGKKAILIGCLATIVPLLCGLAAIMMMIKNKHDQFESFFFPALTCAITAFPVINCLLSELKILNSELARMAQSAAMTSDLLSMLMLNCTFVLRIYMGATTRDEALHKALSFVGLMAAFVFGVAFILRPAMHWIVRHTPQGRPVKDVYIYAVITAFLLSTSISRWYGKFVLLGPYILGLAVPDGPPLGSALAEKFDGLVSGILLPLFVATCAMRIDFKSLQNMNQDLIRSNVFVIVVSILAKFAACLAPLLYRKMPVKDACALAVIMCAKGVVEMGSFSFLYDNRSLPDGMLALMSVAVTVIAIIVPILVKFLYDPSRKYAVYEKRTIMNLSPNSELHMLACIHVPNNVTSVMSLLDASGPAEDRPIAVNVLHLIKLSGQAAPVFISHDRRKNNFSNNTYSENVILSFTKFEANNWGAVAVNVFTAISPPNLMYEDVCTLALDKYASLIVLPFHRRWYIDGAIESEDTTIRTLNKMVLERAPCSVGILLDRGYKRRPISSESSEEMSYNVAMIFLGGNDDREALVYARRMSQDSRVRLTVVRLFSASSEGTTSWAKMLDSEVLSGVKSERHIRYIEQEVKDGPETALIVRSMMEEFDLFIIGRADTLECPQTSGLGEWMEFPELGVIGDLFAASDVQEKFSVLVVQQQQINR